MRCLDGKVACWQLAGESSDGRAAFSGREPSVFHSRHPPGRSLRERSLWFMASAPTPSPDARVLATLRPNAPVAPVLTPSQGICSPSSREFSLTAAGLDIGFIRSRCRGNGVGDKANASRRSLANDFSSLATRDSPARFMDEARRRGVRRRACCVVILERANRWKRRDAKLGGGESKSSI